MSSGWDGSSSAEGLSGIFWRVAAEFGKVRAYLDQFPNLYPVGRNGMHRYNNQDHSMLAANAAVNSIINHGFGKSEIWNIKRRE